MSSVPRRIAALVGVGILFVPAVAGAKPGPKPEKPAKPAKPGPKKEKPAKPVKLATYVFKGVWHADGSVTVNHGNAKVRKGGFVGQTVLFDVSAAKLRVADTDGDGAVTAADLAEGDKVVVQAKLPRKEPGEAPFAARKVVDQSHPASSDDDAEAPAPAPAPENEPTP
jgi:hypothetical protein